MVDEPFEDYLSKMTMLTHIMSRELDLYMNFGHDHTLMA